MRGRKWCIRDKFAELIKYKTWKYVARTYTPLTDEELDAFELDLPHAPQCTLENFRVCFHRPWKTCTFNRHARFVFVHAFLSSITEGYYKGRWVPKELRNKDAVGDVLDTHMIHAREQWRMYQKEAWAIVRDRQLKQKAANSRKATVRAYFR